MVKAGHSTTYEEVQKLHPLYFNIVKKRLWWFVISLLIIIPGIISFFMQGLNLGIDYKGGTMLDMTFNKAVTQTAISDTLKSVGLEGHVQLSNSDTTALIRTEALEEGKRSELLTALGTKVGEYDKASLKEDKVGPAMGQELTRNAIYALIIAMGMMIIYITFRFQFVFAISAILALLHDVLIVVGVFSLFQWEIDATFVAAILTIVGYSINDTVIIFDRIRENEPKMKRGDSYDDMVDKSIWQTMRRSINTVATVLIALLALFILGGESTRMFTLAMLIGVFCGAYSSICIASQILVEIKKRIKKPRRGGKDAVRA
ncbi:protein translocase subunit SecF [Desulfosporosinus sp.]|uniref:protein translocase subunit SecF n=1 Tax=Desulfosporosinus sp. TaxID=157907 RepID=UPI0023268443|nr:protein translocase subunit SecF [Desulfosporosinus sp.]MCO5387065.1 protein translocase subunit SecF [Desulfosporosinus sp.]MDA8223356.1 protein translocase subunit SecF [Desulfitobacterium hafniense]